MKPSFFFRALVAMTCFSYSLIAADSARDDQKLRELQRALFWNVGIDSWAVGNIVTQKKFGDGVYAQRTGAPLAQFNTVFAHGEVRAQNVDEVVAYMNNTAFRWWVASEQGELEKLLEEKGFTYKHEEYLLRAVYNRDDDPSPSLNTKIQLVTNRTQMATWFGAAAHGMNIDENSLGVFLNYLDYHADLSKMQFFIAYDKDELPVATLLASASTQMAGVVSLFSTIDEKNNFVYGKDLLQSRMVVGDNLESDVIMLTTAEQKKWLEDLPPKDVIPLQPFKEERRFRVFEKAAAGQVDNAASRCELF